MSIKDDKTLEALLRIIYKVIHSSFVVLYTQLGLSNTGNFVFELGLPRLLAPDLPSNRSSLKGLKCTHSNYGASKESRIVIFRHYPLLARGGSDEK